MQFHRWKQWTLLMVIVAMPVLARPHAAQAGDLPGALDFIFDDVLNSALQVSPGPHANHFLPERVASSERTILALRNFISTSTSSFPLSSTATGVTFDFSSGVPVPTTTSAGPIFAERATTLGRQKLNVGANFSYLDLARVRGVSTEDISVTMFHQNVGDTAVFGDTQFEYDYITLDMNLDLNAVVFATYATYGITDRIDVGVAIPVVNISMQASPVARMNSYTFVTNDTASHFFGGTKGDPVLWHNVPDVSETATGIGDIALRAKGNFFRGTHADIAGLIEVRLPTGKEEDFLGSGKTSIRFGVIGSGSIGGINPHVNLTYDKRTSDIDRDEIELKLGYDQRLGDNLTLAAEWMGAYEVGDQILETTFADPVVIGPGTSTSQTPSYYVPSTSIPGSSADNSINTSFGLKYTPRPNLLLLANIILPVNNGGLRSNFIPTVGIEFSL